MSVMRGIERIVHNHGENVGLVIMAMILVLLWIPIVVVFIMSFASDSALSFPPESYTLQWYAEVLNNQNAIDATLTSLKVSIVATPIAVVLSLLAALAINRYEFRGKGLIQSALALPIIVPLVVTGVALTMFFGTVNIDSGYGTVLVAHVVRTIPFAALIIIPTVANLDPTMEEASMDLGANEIATFRQVTLPSITPGLVAGGLLAFTISFNEFVITYFVRDTATETLPVYLWSLIRYEATPTVNVISVLFLVFVAVMLLLAASFVGLRRLTLR